VSAVAAVPAGPSIRTRLGEVLKNWGKKVPVIAKKAGNWFKAGFKKGFGIAKKVGKWALEAKITQWVLAKAKPVWNKAWPVIKGPVLWLAAPVVVVLAMPKVMLVLLGCFFVGLMFALWRASRERKQNTKVYTDAEWDAIKDVIGHAKRSYTSVRLGKSVTEYREAKITMTKKGRLQFHWRAIPDVVKVTPSSRARKESETEEQYQARVAEVLKGEAGDTNGLTLNGEPTPGETISLRYQFLDEQTKVAGENEDIDLLSEAMGRINMIEVRTGMTQSKVKADAKPQVIHADLRKWCTATFPGHDWNWKLMYDAAVSESTRLKELTKMQEELATAS